MVHFSGGARVFCLFALTTLNYIAVCVSKSRKVGGFNAAQSRLSLCRRVTLAALPHRNVRERSVVGGGNVVCRLATTLLSDCPSGSYGHVQSLASALWTITER